MSAVRFFYSSLHLLNFNSMIETIAKTRSKYDGTQWELAGLVCGNINIIIVVVVIDIECHFVRVKERERKKENEVQTDEGKVTYHRPKVTVVTQNDITAQYTLFPFLYELTYCDASRRCAQATEQESIMAMTFDLGIWELYTLAITLKHHTQLDGFLPFTC